jgi:hypothetical protein
MTKFIKPPAVAVVAAILCLLLVTACGLKAGTGAPGGVAGTLARLEPLTASCNGEINAYDGVDASASGRGDPSLFASRLQALKDMADQAAACGGYMKAVAFSSSAAETFTLGEAEFPTSSGTETARLIEANKAEDGLLGEVEDNLSKALRQLNPNGTDALAQLTLAKQFEAQRPSGKLDVQLETDGIATTKPVVMNTPAFTAQTARAAARRVTLPKLDGASVRIAGIGQTTGTRRLSTVRTNALTTFYELACRRTGAECLITTDYTRGG